MENTDENFEDSSINISATEQKAAIQKSVQVFKKPATRKILKGKRILSTIFETTETSNSSLNLSLSSFGSSVGTLNRAMLSTTIGSVLDISNLSFVYEAANVFICDICGNEVYNLAAMRKHVLSHAIHKIEWKKLSHLVYCLTCKVLMQLKDFNVNFVI